VSRPLVSLYRLDRDRLAALSGELRDLLSRDDRVGFAALLGLGEQVRGRVNDAHWTVELMLRPDDDPHVVPIFASLRRVAKTRALEQVWTSNSPALEGRLRAYDILREEPTVAAKIDRLLDANRVPWFLQRPGATCGWLPDAERSELAEELEGLGPALPDEVSDFARGLSEVDGDVLLHDRF
jgi:hypothetical protein